MKRTFLIFSISIILFLICGAPSISFRVVRPAILDVPDYITSLCIINRSVQTDNSKGKIEGGLTAEIPGGDKIASQYALEGLITAIQNSGRYSAIRNTKTYTKNSLPESFPEVLTWTEIENLCAEFKVSGIIALEVFDSDYIIPTSMTRVTVGFRFYDPKERIIIDQNIFTHEMVWNNKVNSIAGAINRFVEKERAVKDVSYEAGMIYGEKISPSWVTIQREYYRKGKRNQDLKVGARMMEVNDWDAAKESLQKAMESKKRKTRGRAAHNMAVVYEILGDYEQAKKWAQDAWGKYQNKGSKNYSYILSERIRENQILREQGK
jgi:hypothetical protein